MINNALLCPWESPHYLIFSSNVPTLLQYSHIPVVIVALFLGLFVYFKSKTLASKLLLVMVSLFSVYVMLDSIIWASNRSDLVMFLWSLQILIEPMVFIFGLYLVYVFVTNTDVGFNKKLFFFLPLLPFILLVPTKYNLSGMRTISCDANEGPVALYYSYALEAFFVLTIAFFIIKAYVREKDIDVKKKIILLGVGITLFLLAFSWGNIVGSFTEDWKLAQYGLFGMPVFIGFLAYIIVKFKAFNIKLIGTQALVAILLILVGALLFVNDISTVRIIVGITLLAALIVSFFLVRSVKKEVEQREALEVANAEITERKEQLQKMADSLSISNEKLKITYDKLEELDRAKADFISLANHQLKHAPTTIKSFMSMLLDGDYGEVPESQIKVLKNVNDANDRQIRLADDLLQIIKMESNKVQLDFQKQSIEDVCQGVYDNLSAAAKERSLKLSYEKPEQALPEVLFDKNKVFEAIFNFVDNAIKYTKEGGITVKAEVSPSSSYKPQNSDDADKKPIQGSVVRVVVSDTGSGISKEHLGQLFAKFSRKDTSNLNSGGTGLGLFLVKLMIEAHGGRTWAESDGEGKGSRFIMELPIETPKEILEQVEGK